MPRATVTTMIMRGGGGDVPDVPFKDSYADAEIKSLWNTVKKVYGSPEAARAAVNQNNQVLCPLYASPALLTQSYSALISIFGKEEALEIMQKNPAVLTCGQAGLLKSEPSEIRNAANARKFLDAYVTPQGFGIAVLVVLLLNVVFRVSQL